MFTAVREDGTATSSVIGPAEGFGPVHDLAHYVVETSLGFKSAFLGLLASGRNLEDFETGAKHWLPGDAISAERIAGQLSLDEMTRMPLSVEDFNGTVHATLTADQLVSMRARLADLRREWDSLAPGETLELEFDPQQIECSPLRTE